MAKKGAYSPRNAAIFEWYAAGIMEQHWDRLRKLFGEDQPIDPKIVFRVVDYAIFSNDDLVLNRGLKIIADGTAAGRPLFTYSRKVGVERIAGLFGIYRSHFRSNAPVARYLVSLIAASKLLRECCDYLVELQTVLPDEPAVAKTTIVSLRVAGRDREALPILEALRKTGQMEKAHWTLLDRILIESGHRAAAQEVFRDAASLHSGDVQFLVDAIRAREKANATAEADFIQQTYLDRIPLTGEIAELKMRRLMKAHRFEDAVGLAVACSKGDIESEVIRALKAQCQMEMVTGLTRAARDEEALAVLEDIRSAGRLNRTGWIMLDRIVTGRRLPARAKKVFEEGAAAHGRDIRFLASAIRARDKVGELAEADLIQRRYLDELPVNEEIAELKMRRLIRVHRFGDAVEIAMACSKKGVGSQAIAALGADCYMEMGLPGKAREFLEEIESRCGVLAADGWGLVDYFMRIGSHRQAQEHLLQLERREKSSDVPKWILETRRSEIDVFDKTAHILSRIPIAAQPKGLVVLFSRGGCLSHLWMGLTAAELKKSGFAVVFPYVYGRCEVEKTGDPDIDSLHGLLDFSMKRLTDEPEGIPPRRFEWTIDIDRGIVSACGLNFFQPICARVGTILKRYRFSFDHPVAKATLEAHISIADAVLAMCERMRRTLGARGIPVRFLSGMTHYVPAAVLRQYCNRYGAECDMNYVGFVAAYEHYYTNLKNDRSGALSMRNLTKHRTLNSPARVHASEFDAWRQGLDEPTKSRMKSEMMSIINFDRTRKQDSPEAATVRERIRSHKAAGGSVVCLFGKILYDIWMDEPGGTVHEDIADWVNHSIDAVAGSNTILLVKPHPNEINPLLATPTEFFTDLIQAPINGNVIVCQHKWFNVGDLLQYLDLGLLWSGTASLELQAHGIPVLMSSKWGLQDHPVPFVEVRSRDHYAALLRDPAGLQVAQDVRERSWLLLKYYSTPEVMIPYGYGNMRYLRGNDIGPPRWYMDKVEEYFKHGDPHVERMAQKCL